MHIMEPLTSKTNPELNRTTTYHRYIHINIINNNNNNNNNNNSLTIIALHFAGDDINRQPKQSLYNIFHYYVTLP